MLELKDPNEFSRFRKYIIVFIDSFNGLSEDTVSCGRCGAHYHLALSQGILELRS